MSTLNVTTVTATNVTATGTVDATQGVKLGSFSDATRPTPSGNGYLIYNTTSSDVDVWKGTAWAGLGAANLRTWTTATRPAGPTTAQIGYNTETNSLEIYNGTAWAEIAPAAGGAASVPWSVTDSTSGSSGSEVFPSAQGNVQFDYTGTHSPSGGGPSGYYEGNARHVAFALGDMSSKSMKILVQAAGSGGHRDDYDGATPGDDGNMVYINFNNDACKNYFTGSAPKYLHVSLGSRGNFSYSYGANDPVINPITPYSYNYPGVNRSNSRTQGTYGGMSSCDSLVWVSDVVSGTDGTGEVFISKISGGNASSSYDGGSGGTPSNATGTTMDSGITVTNYRSRQNGGNQQGRTYSSPRQVPSHWMTNTDSRRSEMDHSSFSGTYGYGGSFQGQQGSWVNGGYAMCSIIIY